MHAYTQWLVRPFLREDEPPRLPLRQVGIEGAKSADIR